MPVNQELLEAVKQRDAQRVRAILTAEPEALQRTAGEESAVQTAAYYGAQEVLAELLPHASLDIFEATAVGDAARVTDLLAADPAAAGAYSYDGWTALHLAGFFGRAEIAAGLLAAGADVQALSRNDMANQPLHASLAGTEDAATVEHLLQAGADVNRPEHGGYAALPGGLPRQPGAGGAPARLRRVHHRPLRRRADAGGYRRCPQLPGAGGISADARVAPPLLREARRRRSNRRRIRPMRRRQPGAVAPAVSDSPEK